MTHWSDTRWASWGVALLILVSVILFGALGCQKPIEARRRDNAGRSCADPNEIWPSRVYDCSGLIAK